MNGSRPVTGERGKVVIPERIQLDQDVGLLRAPLLVGSTSLAVASDDPSGGPASHVVRIDGTHVVDVVDFKARVLVARRGRGRALGAHAEPADDATARFRMCSSSASPGRAT